MPNRPDLRLREPDSVIVHPRGTLLWETGLNDAVYRGRMCRPTALVPLCDRLIRGQATKFRGAKFVKKD